MKVQLFGGGIDSVCIAHLEKPDVKVYFKLGTVESEREAAVAYEAGCVIDTRLYLGDQVLANKILPARNLLLVGLAAFYGNDIILGATAGDTTRDKDATFMQGMTDVLQHTLGHDPDKALRFHQDGLRVRAPAQTWTKTQLVARYLQAGGSRDDLLRSRSCYEGHSHECGQCRSCARKYVAMSLNGFLMDDYFIAVPDLHEAREYALARNRGAESADIQKLIESR